MAKKPSKKADSSPKKRKNPTSRVDINTSKERTVNINIIDSPLDFYRSPHLLDLSETRFIERVRPTSAGLFGSSVFQYDFPGGEFLSKIYSLGLLDWQDSEILSAWRKIYNFLFFRTKKLFVSVDLTPKLPLIKDKKIDFNSSRFLIWHDITFINLLIFLTGVVMRSSEFIYQVYSYASSAIVDLFRGKDDEVINFGQTVDDFADSELTEVEAEPLTVANPVFKPSPGILDFLRKDEILPQAPTKNVFKAERAESDFIKPKRVLSFPRFSEVHIEFPTPKIDWSRFNFFLADISWKPVIAFILLTFLLVLPFKSFSYWSDVNETKGIVLGEAEEAVNNLNLAQSELLSYNFDSAEDYFGLALDNFSSAKGELANVESFATFLIEIIPNNIFRSGKNLLGLGYDLSSAGQRLLAGVNSLTEESDAPLTKKIERFKSDSSFAIAKLKSAEVYLEKINFDHLPKENIDQFIKLKETLPTFISSLEEFQGTADFLVKFLGDDSLRRYLIVFQNDNELRATGGFMGSFALVDIKSGEIEDIDIPSGGTYDVRAGLNELLKAPEPMRLINSRWEFQDSNWWPDWQKSGEKIAYFYNKSGGPTVDGVIAINSDWLGQVLGFVGDIDLPEYGKTINAANFEMELQKSVELEYEDKSQPKRILGDLAPRIIESLFDLNPSKIVDMLMAVNNGFSARDLQVYFTDDELENFAADNDWDGRLKNSPKDYLSVVATNIGGGKTDNVIKQAIRHQAEVMPDGSIIDYVMISRYHFGPVDTYFTDYPNRSYLRIYVPEGSELLSAEGFVRPDSKEFKEAEDFLDDDPDLLAEEEAVVHQSSQTKIYNEDGKTVFANWLVLNPGENRDVLLVYRLPFKIDDEEAQASGLIEKIVDRFSAGNNYGSYSLLVQKQPGSGDDSFFSELITPAGFEVNQSYPSLVDSVGSQSYFSDILNSDLFYFISLKYRK